MKLESKIIKLIEEFLKEEFEETIELTIDSRLFGGGGPLDSMALVNLILEIEEFVEDELGKTITLADEKAMSRRTSPFAKVSYLIDYINEKIATNE
jgi:acyl carrier protein